MAYHQSLVYVFLDQEVPDSELILRKSIDFVITDAHLKLGSRCGCP